MCDQSPGRPRQPQGGEEAGRGRLRLMQKQAPSIGRIFVMVAVRAVVLRHPALPLARLRRLDPAEAAGLPLQRQLPGGDQARPGGRRAHLGRAGRQGEEEGARRRRRRDVGRDRARRQYAPIPADTKAILRQKTLLGETYVELTPGTKDGPRSPTAASSPRARCRRRSSSTRSSARSTRRRARRSGSGWTSRAARSTAAARTSTTRSATSRRSPSDTRDVLEILDRHERATQQLVRDTGVVFDALTERQGQLQ